MLDWHLVHEGDIISDYKNCCARLVDDLPSVVKSMCCNSLLLADLLYQDCLLLSYLISDDVQSLVSSVRYAIWKTHRVNVSGLTTGYRL